MIAAHAMHSSSGRSGRGANVNISRRSGVMSPRRSKQKLTNVSRAASDISSYEVRVHALKIGRRKNAPRQNAIAEAGSEPINLILQFLKHTHRGAVGHMTISPRRMFTRGSACAVEKTGLGQQNEWMVGIVSRSYCLFRRGNLIKASAQVHRRCSETFGSFPGNRCAQRVIYFENTGSVAKSPQLLPVTI